MKTPAAVKSEPITPATPPTSQPARPREAIPWELILGGNWLVRVGILAVIIGVAFFLKLAFDNQWIDETERVVMGVVGGVGLLGLAEYLRMRYPTYSQALSGGGVAVLYVSIFAAFSFYGLIGLYPAVGALFLISVTAAALALRYDSTALAVIGILGAFAAPFILGATEAGATEAVTATASEGGLQVMVYVVIVDAGVLALSTVRNWRWFTFLALLGSLASFGIWYADSGGQVSLAAAQGSLTAVFLIFVGATTLFHVVRRRAPQPLDHALMVINAAAYFGISYGLMWSELREWMGGFTLLLALFYMGLAYAVSRRGKEQSYLSYMALSIALVLLTVAAPVQLGSPWVSVAWAAEGAALVWLSFALRMPLLRLFGAAASAIFVVWLLLADTLNALTSYPDPPYYVEVVRVFLEVDAGEVRGYELLTAYAVGIAATFLAAWLLRRNESRLTDKEKDLFPAFLSAGVVLLTVAVPVHVEIARIEGAWVAAAWAVESLALVWLSARLGIHELGALGVGVLVVMTLRLIIFDTLVDLDEFRFALNYRMMAFASGIAVLYVVALQAASGRWRVLPPDRRELVPGLLITANFLTLWILSAEWIAVVDSGLVNVTGDAAFYAKSLGLSLTWGVYASAALALGIVRRLRMVRLAGLGLLAIPVLKLFLLDSFALEQGYRVAAFLSLGAIMLVGGFLYQRHGAAIRGFLFDDRQA